VSRSDSTSGPRSPEDLYAELEGGQLLWDEKTGQLHKAQGFLTKQSDEAPEHVAQGILDRYSRLLGKHYGSVLDDFRLERVTSTPGGYEVRFGQYVGDVPVFRAGASIHLSEEGQAYRITNEYRADAMQVDVAHAVQEGIDASEACQVAVDAVEGADRLRRAPEARLVIYPLDETSSPAWQVSVALTDPAESWLVFVQVDGGSVLERIPTLARRAG
jgi:Zn-dependent metalloprotease